MFSRIVFFLCSLILLYASFVFYPRWKQEKNNAVISWDVSGYYWYLPSIFIYHDLKQQSFKDSILEKYQPTSGVHDFQQAFKHQSGNYVMKYSSGMALMYSPFFAIAHILASTLGFPADGFSQPYQLAIQLGGLLVSLIGFWFFRKFLLNFYSDMVVAICLFFLVVGTNYLNYASIDSGMTHCWLFTIYVFILHATYLFYKQPTIKLASVLGFLCGLATLTRPTDLISVFIPLLWGLHGFTLSAIKNQFKFLKFNYKYLLVSFFVGSLVVSLQVFYWKYTTNEWLVYSYQDQGFKWLHPHFGEYIFGAHNGWLTYSPILIGIFLGLIPFWRSWANGRIAVVIFLILDLYLVSSWEFYYYGGRFMIQAYPILFLSLASFVAWLLAKKLRVLLSLPILCLFVYIGLWTNIQYHKGDLYDWDMSNWKYYFATVGRWKVSDDIFKLKDTDELFQGKPQNKVLVYANDFEKDSLVSSDEKFLSKQSIYLNEKVRSRQFSFQFQNAEKNWIRAEAQFTTVLQEWNVWNMTQFIVKLRCKGNDIKTKMIRVHRFLYNGATKRIYIDIKLPKQPIDEVAVSFWNNESQETILIDDLRVWTFDE